MMLGPVKSAIQLFIIRANPTIQVYGGWPFGHGL